ncbi:hypothetical protein V5738_11050 [Salinisphaera sp. SPP-AMP-43]|uniref:hypothetical protein n=1 Tax=Salinisphaera sp. SPP-AMP-43 TaxID=3121288 RepID=UPI003C6E73A3
MNTIHNKRPDHRPAAECDADPATLLAILAGIGMAWGLFEITIGAICALVGGA